jgi:hypothetical protein
MASLRRCTLIASLVVLCFSSAFAIKTKKTQAKNNMKKISKSRNSASTPTYAPVTSADVCPLEVPIGTDDKCPKDGFECKYSEYCCCGDCVFVQTCTCTAADGWMCYSLVALPCPSPCPGGGNVTSSNVTGTPCGSRGLEPCPDGQTCIDPDLTDSCTPLADCPGICAPIQTCGGFAGFRCPEGLTCVDDPNDSCDPMAGGADCGGICLLQAPPDCPSAESWPELVGATGKAAKATIEAQQPCLMVFVIDEGSFVTLDYRLDRVRIFVDAKGIVSSTPMLG